MPNIVKQLVKHNGFCLNNWLDINKRYLKQFDP